MNSSNTQALPVALVTGGARRIGRAIVKHLHEAGFRVIIHCHHSLDEASELAQTLNRARKNSALVLSSDLNQTALLEPFMLQATQWAMRLDLLVNNASLFIKTDAENYVHHWDTQFNVNVKAPFILSQLAYPFLAKTSGSIVNITDIHANKPLKQYSAYCQSKAALVMQTKSLAREYAPLVRVNAIAPGAIIWPEGENDLNTTLQQQIIEKTPLKRHGDPCYIADAVLALASNAFITGQILSVDGGRSLT